MRILCDSPDTSSAVPHMGFGWQRIQHPGPSRCKPCPAIPDMPPAKALRETAIPPQEREKLSPPRCHVTQGSDKGMADIADSITDNAPSRTPCPSPEAAGDAPKWRLEASPSPSPPHSGGQLPLSPCPLPPSPLPLTSAPLRHGACRPRRLAGGAPPAPASRKWPPSTITAPCRGAPRYLWGMRGPFGVPSRPLVARSSLACVFPPG